jgi:hypothetical protein
MNSMTMFEFAADAKIRHLTVYLQQLAGSFVLADYFPISSAAAA